MSLTAGTLGAYSLHHLHKTISLLEPPAHVNMRGENDPRSPESQTLHVVLTILRHIWRGFLVTAEKGRAADGFVPASSYLDKVKMASYFTRGLSPTG